MKRFRFTTPSRETIIAAGVTNKIYDFPFIVTFEPSVRFDTSGHRRGVSALFK